MKNLYHKNKGKVHPSLEAPNRDVLTVLKLLPAAILALVSVLSLDDREVLAYLITRSINTTSSPASMIEEKKKCKRSSPSNTHKPPIFDCGCFDCYTSYWFRWDSSPNRELIHQAIEAFEDHLAKGERSQKINSTRGGRKRDKSSRRLAQKQPNKPEQAAEDLVPTFLELEKKSLSNPESGACPVTTTTEEKMGDLEEDQNNKIENEQGKPDGGVMTGNLTHSIQNGQSPAAATHRLPARKVMPDVFGLFNSRFWSLWNPNI